MFDHEPVFCDLVFRLREFFTTADSPLTATAVEFTISGSLESTAFPAVRWSRSEVLFVNLRNRSIFYFCWFLDDLWSRRITFLRLSTLEIFPHISLLSLRLVVGEYAIIHDLF